MNYQIFSDATADFSAEMLEGLPEAVIIPMNITVDGQSYVYGPEGDITEEEFYELIRQGKMASTSQVNPYTYSEYFRKTLDEGKDLIYLCFTSGLSQNYRNACLSMEELQEEYPDRKIIILIPFAHLSDRAFFFVRLSAVRLREWRWMHWLSG